ncbi:MULTISPECIES: HAD-IA family hydrolase [unclassified Rhodococcus (in: high G+C Gram-positive bacteria)]|uniref:HAD-IA family hydrolase n=1 Tax=unclassified Rhodococcus (in: high G+C Gram-positive bacteria) TaxID=192944 RepID=UPI0024B8176E|nr:MULTISPECIES: HAD-IA family hydrolase [unclassified Rhodococcus (in: high G+C Gram-positive bacteria)]MDI9958167.1 HAD-IA family hydrolase [Rhodococcus sp. IEGM 1237]MDI9963622.1 HAD-IA family hydrolase [Rhodococcus sp. IEGM 1251]MDV8126073.1 HAD-IA family hydrolase [Rhodococcus sp. IEGM 1304]
MRGLLLDVGGVLFGPGSDLDGLSAVVRAVRARGIVTGIVSNDPGGANAQWLRDLGDGVLVDDVILSGDVEMAKPDAEIYLLAASRLGVDPGELVFVDDLEVNVRAAVAVGMVGVHHVGSESTIEELSILFDLGEGGDTKPW